MMRVDIWLDIACLFKSRSEAATACKNGRVFVNGSRAKAHRDISVGDGLQITLRPGRTVVLIVDKLTDKHIKKTEARQLYTDSTPPPSKSEIELRELLRRVGPVPGAGLKNRRSLDRRDQRLLRRLKTGQ